MRTSPTPAVRRPTHGVTAYVRANRARRAHHTLDERGDRAALASNPPHERARRLVVYSLQLIGR